MAQNRCYKLIVEGEVQGVGFRGFVKNLAKYLGITGYVRNHEDGTVEIFVEGVDSIERFVDLLKKESPTTIWDIKIYEEPCKGYQDFYIVP